MTGHVTEGPKPGQSADCTGQFTIKAFEPPYDQLLGESVVGESGRLVEYFGERDEPAESSSDLQLQRDGRFGQRHWPRRRR